MRRMSAATLPHASPGAGSSDAGGAPSDAGADAGGADVQARQNLDDAFAAINMTPPAGPAVPVAGWQVEFGGGAEGDQS